VVVVGCPSSTLDWSRNHKQDDLIPLVVLQQRPAWLSWTRCWAGEARGQVPESRASGEEDARHCEEEAMGPTTTAFPTQFCVSLVARQ
jgi:hypothetical protein